jgi:aryl-alcohol dehydrogenase-like predicted oxidoreductase
MAMEYRLLGLSGCAVSALALGTLTFGNETSETDSFAQLDRFVAAGGTLIDTADVYADGRAEQIIGRWLSRRADARDLVVIATKGRFPTSDSPNGHGLSRRHLTAALDASLTRLGVDTIDLYQLHGWDPLTPVEETLRFLDDAAQAGKISYFGLSNFLGYQIQKYVDLAGRHGLIGPVTVQPQYNLLARAIEWEVVPACEAEGLGLLPWSPLASGWLTGKYRRDAPPGEGTRLSDQMDQGMRIWNEHGRVERDWQVIEAVRKVADGRGASMSQVAIGWVLARPAVRSVILGARTLAQLDDNLAAGEEKLSDEETRILDAASDPGAPDYPYGERGQTQRDRRIAGGRF